MNTLKTLGLAAALSAALAGSAWAQTQTTTIKSAPANFQGDSFGSTEEVGTGGAVGGTDYIDVQNAGNGTGYESFGVIDFTGNSVYNQNTKAAETIASMSQNITLTLSDTAYTYTSPTTVNFFLSDSSTPLSGLTYQTSDTSQTAGVGNQLGNLFYLGTVTDTDTGGANSGSTFTYHLSLPSAAETYFMQQLNSNVNPAHGDTTTTPNYTNLRLVMTAADPNNPDGVASFGGSTNGSPELTFTTVAAVPEASTTVSLGVLLALGLGGLAIARRRRTA